MSSPRVLVHRVGAPHELRTPVRCRYPPSKLAATTPAPQFLSSRHETALCCSLTDTTSIALLLQANTPPWQTSKCSSWVDAGLFGAKVGFTSPLVAPSSQLQQLWAYQAIAHHRTLVAWKFGSTITKNVRSLSQSLLVSMQKANELTSSAPRTSNWRPARAGAAPTNAKCPL